MFIRDWIRRSSTRSWTLPATSGVLLAAAYYGPLPVAQWLAFLPILAWLDAHPEAGGRARFRAGLIFGASAHLLTLHFWFTLVDVTWLVVLLYLLLVVLFTLKIGLAVAVLGRLRHATRWSYGLLLPAVWLPIEWAGSLLGDLRMTVDHVGYALSGFPFLVQFADLVGPYGVGAFLLAINGLLWDSLGWIDGVRPPERRRGALLALAVLTGAVLAYDTWAWVRPEPDGPVTRVALVQPDIALTTKMSPDTVAEQWQTLAELTRRAAAADPDLIVWPESADPNPLVHRLDLPQTFRLPQTAALAREVGVPLLVGAEYYRVRGRDDYDLFNAAVVVRSDGTLADEWAAKVYLVPFAEALPYRALFGRWFTSREGDWRWIVGAFAPGPRNAVLEAAGARIGVLVCFEQMFDVLARGLRNAGAEFQVVITNDAWWDRTIFQQYLADALRLRAIENRTAIVRVANTGISGFVDAKGRYRFRTGLFEEAVEVYDVARSSERTLYTRTGNLVMLFPLVTLVLAFLRARR